MIDSEKSSSKRAVRLLLPLLVIGAAIALTSWMLASKPKAKPHTPTRVAPLVEVTPLHFAAHTPQIRALGQVVASRSVALSARVSGTVSTLAPQLIPGGRFRQGEMLLQLDDADYRLARTSAEAAVTRATATLQQEEGEQQVAQEAYRLLGETVTPEEEALLLRQPQYASAKAALAAAQAELDKAELDLARTRLIAPFNAVVASREVNRGALVSPGTTVATLIGSDDCWVEVAVPQKQLPWIALPTAQTPGATVELRDDAVWPAGVSRRGEVIALAAAVEEEGRLARLLVRVADPFALRPESAGLPPLLLGSHLSVAIAATPLPHAAAIDRSALRDGDNIWLFTPEKTLEIRPLTILFRAVETVYVTTGVSEGEQLIVSPLPTPVAEMPLRLGDETP